MPSPRISPLLILLLILGLVLLSILEQPLVSSASSGPCRLSEFMCDDGQCISLSRYCDGIENCDGGSDEVLGCTNCNRTFYGDINVKLPIRITGPFQRYLPFVCMITFVAAGKEYGDIVELTFLSFQIGALDFTRNQTPICQKGYLQIIEKSSSRDGEERNIHMRQLAQPLSSLLQMSSSPMLPVSGSYSRDGAGDDPEFGHFCGDMIGRSVTFFSIGSNVSLFVVVPSRASIPSSSFSLYLTYKFLSSGSSTTRYGPDDSPFYVGTRSPGAYCDRTYVNCDRKNCKIRSPNFPGFYPRNITCNIWIRQVYVPKDRHAQIVLSQKNEYKISIYTGSSTTASFPRRMLTTDCFSDVVRVFDGSSAKSPLLMEFCGSGALPDIVSSGPELLVQLYSAPYQLLYNSRIELDVDVKFVPSAEFRLENGRCTYTIDGTQERQGVIRSPKHTMPRNTTCIFRLSSASRYDRIWLYFVSFFIMEKQQLSSPETCSISKLELYDSISYYSSSVSNGSGSNIGSMVSVEPTYWFCEKSSPRMCVRAADHQDFVPLRPCEVPTESYVSSGPELIIKHHFFTPSEVVTSSSSFVARYEFVYTRQDGLPINNSECDRRFDSRLSKQGSFSSSRNVFFYGRGGRENISCMYHFIGLPTERVRITLYKIRLKTPFCERYYDPALHRHGCRVTDATSNLPVGSGMAGGRGRQATITSVEYWDGYASPLGCLCNITSVRDRPVVFESLVNNVKLTFTVTHMTPFEDFEDFGFEANYLFINSTLCDNGLQKKTALSEGVLFFEAPDDVKEMALPLRCRWQIEAGPHKYLYLKFKGLNSSSDCKFGNRLLVYLETHSKPVASACVDDSLNEEDFDIFSYSWYNDSHGLENWNPFSRDRLFVEILASQPGIFTVHWLEVTKPFIRTQSGQTLRNVNCLFECPEINACIDPELWCDGNVHCPSGYDEAPDHCRRFPTMYVAAGTAGGFVILVIMLAVIKHRWNRRLKKKNVRRVPTEDFQMESPVG